MNDRERAHGGAHRLVGFASVPHPVLSGPALLITPAGEIAPILQTWKLRHEVDPEMQASSLRETDDGQAGQCCGT